MKAALVILTAPIWLPVVMVLFIVGLLCLPLILVASLLPSEGY